jgi:N-formylglutamate amidohydrolase
LRRLAGEEELELLATYFHPYAEALADLVDETIARHGRCTIVDLHSYPQHPLPYELNPTAARPAVCIGTDDLHTPSSLAAAARSAFADVEVCENTPFAGTYVPLRHYGTDLRVSSVMIEIRRDLYLDEASGAPIAPGVHAMADAVSNLVRIAGTV